MERPETAEVIQPSANMYRLISYSLVACMMTCAAFTVTGFVGQGIASTGWQPTRLVGLYFIVALDSLLSYRFSHRSTFLSRRSLIFLAQQIIFIIAISKIAIGLSHGWDSFLREIPTWGQNFPTHFFDAEMLFTLGLALLTWLISESFASHLEAIGPAHPITDSSTPPRPQLIALFFTVGAILITLTLLSRIDLTVILSNKIKEQTQIELTLLEKGGASTLLYCILGLILLSQTYFTSLRTGWYIQKTPVSRQLVGQWMAYSLLFTGLMFFIINLPPTLPYKQSLLITPADATRPFRTPQAVTPIPQPNLPIPNLPPQEETTNPFIINLSQVFESIKRIIAWVIVISLAILLVGQALRDYENLIEKIRNLRGWGWLAQLLAGLQNVFRHIKNTLSSLLESSFENVSQLLPGQNRDGFMNLRKLTPRQQVYFFYLAFVRRANEKGLPRSRAQTPSEYAATLQNNLPSAAEDIHALTEAFIRARYSRQPVETEDSQRVESIWQRIRKMLRGRK